MTSSFLSTKPRSLAFWQTVKERVRLRNEDVKNHLSSLFKDRGLKAEAICLATTGSDGRLEKGHASELELVLYHSEQSAELAARIDALLAHLVSSGSCSFLTHETRDVKNIERPGISYVYGNRNLPYPSRIFDSYPIYGDSDLLLSAKRGLIKDFTGPDGKSILGRIKSRRNSYRSIMLTGKQKWKGVELVHYDLDAGLAYYSVQQPGTKGQGHLRSFKYGPLRFVQSVMELGVVGLVREMHRVGRTDDAFSVLARLPTPTVDKLNFLADFRFMRLTRTELDLIIDCYINFLDLYYTSEFSSIQGHQNILFNKQEVKERIDALNRLLENGLFNLERIR